ncbi:hypothetical protein E2562_035453 [Oryza meyeriana var. granulata]|uniref:Uncharacterized protein n=1 Tax=Oryza meyeriana var. granulata TaxID=110450 RepID=A0A6G1CVQ9_9ORYZ|nr:hypothetical protein E2562_035453 [Oryza meyeriana var. granulata]
MRAGAGRERPPGGGALATISMSSVHVVRLLPAGAEARRHRGQERRRVRFLPRVPWAARRAEWQS